MSESRFIRAAGFIGISVIAQEKFMADSGYALILAMEFSALREVGKQ